MLFPFTARRYHAEVIHKIVCTSQQPDELTIQKAGILRAYRQIARQLYDDHAAVSGLGDGDDCNNDKNDAEGRNRLLMTVVMVTILLTKIMLMMVTLPGMMVMLLLMVVEKPLQTSKLEAA